MSFGLFDSKVLFLVHLKHPPERGIRTEDRALSGRWLSSEVQFGAASEPSGGEGLGGDGQFLEIRSH